MKNLHWTSKYMACVSCPMVLLAMQKYSPASVYWMSLRVREDILICPCTTIRPSKVCKEKKRVSIPKASSLRVKTATMENIVFDKPKSWCTQDYSQSLNFRRWTCQCTLCTCFTFGPILYFNACWCIGMSILKQLPKHIQHLTYVFKWLKYSFTFVGCIFMEEYLSAS